MAGADGETRDDDPAESATSDDPGDAEPSDPTPEDDDPPVDPPVDDAPCPRLVATAAGVVCATHCAEGTCPQGQLCQSFGSVGGAPGTFCVEPAATQCQPCLTDLDCNPYMDGALGSDAGVRSRCLDLGPLGAFCGAPCELGCGPGEICGEKLVTMAGDLVTRCVSPGGTCACNALGIALSAQTECYKESPLGKCAGVRECTAAGLSPCPVGAPGTEICNFADDDCDGEIDEGVESPCGECAKACTFKGIPGAGGAVDAAAGVDGEGPDVTTEILSNRFIWIANSAEDTVSRLDTDTGCEVARYPVCSNPSRTAVDQNGNGYVGCRGDGQVARIAVLQGQCKDFNGNGLIDTSRDLNEDCQITADEMIAGDECVVWMTAPGGIGDCSGNGGGCIRAAGVDAEGYVWVGSWTARVLYKLQAETGAVVTTLPLSIRPYGLAIADTGAIWVASRDPMAIAVVDPGAGEIDWGGTPQGAVYGMAVDPFGAVWVASGEAGGVQRFDSNTGEWSWSGNLGRGNTRGVAVKVDRDEAGNPIGGRVYVAHHHWSDGCNNSGAHRFISVWDIMSGEPLAPVDLGGPKAPVGVAVDATGQLWTVNQCDSSASKVDTATHAVIGTYGVGLQPYTYSDMTGYTVQTNTYVKGEYRHIFNGWQETNTTWESIDVDVNMPAEGAWLELQWRVATDVVGLNDTPWNGPFGPFPPQALPLQLEVTAPVLDVKVTGYAASLETAPQLNAVLVSAHRL